MTPQEQQLRLSDALGERVKAQAYQLKLARLEQIRRDYQQHIEAKDPKKEAVKARMAKARAAKAAKTKGS